MRMTTRLLVGSAFAAGLLAPATAASAAINPADALACVSEGAAGVAALVDPANISVPPELAAAHCLAP